ncbi:MAG: polysaccharide biosynthesis/export family protein [bacterium]|nr:polysaccharide biosynthesis/export family protein [bacterium]
MQIIHRIRLISFILFLGLTALQSLPLQFSAGAIEPSSTTASSDAYRIRIEDTIVLSVWQHADLNVSAVVGPDGTISMPLVGEISVNGLTKQAAQELVTTKLKKYVKEPVVTINVTEYGGRRVRVLGQVNNPGSFSFVGQITLLEAVSRAGGPNNTAQLRQCAIFRGTETVIEIDLYELLYEKNMKLDIPLQPGDTVFIPDNINTQVFVLGEVNNPGSYALGGHLTVLEAITRAGSYTENANLNQVCIVRGALQKPEIIQVDIKQQIKKGIIPKQQNLKPNDIVFVPKGVIGKLNFVLDQISPSLRTIILGDSALKAIQGKETSQPSITLP